MLWEEILGYTTKRSIMELNPPASSPASPYSFRSSKHPDRLQARRRVSWISSSRNFEAPEMRDLPLNVLELASETMKATYPPEPINYRVSMWMVWSLAAAVEHCPMEFRLGLLQTVQEGLSLCLADESAAWLENNMMYDVRFFCLFFFHFIFH